MPTRILRSLAICALVFVRAGSASAQVAVSANDSKVVLVDGVNTVVRTPQPDTATILDVSGWPPRVVGEVRVPASVVGPPQSVAIMPDRSLAVITGAMKIDPANPSATVPDDVVTVVNLRASPPAVLTTLHAGRQASGVSINAAGTLALVANRAEGTISVFRMAGTSVTAGGKVDLGAPDSGPSHVVFTPDGRRALVSRNNDSLISILEIDGANVAYNKHDVVAGVKPYGVDVTPRGDLAVVANIGAGQTGGVDTITVVDLTTNPPRAVDHLTIGVVPEGIAISPDGRFVAVTVMNGSNQPKSSPIFHDFGLLKILRFNGQTLRPVTEARIGRWCQGVGWTADSRGVLVQCMVEREIQMFRFVGARLAPGTSLKTPGGPAGLRIR